jgi:hypothetical protein
LVRTLGHDGKAADVAQVMTLSTAETGKSFPKRSMSQLAIFVVG